MPVLASEPNVFPPALFESTPGSEFTAHLWWVLHVKPRQEKSLARHLLSSRIPFYLPLIEQSRRSRGRKLTAYHPLFAGYLFLLAQHEERLAALTTNRIVRSIQVPDQANLWNDLRGIARLIASGAPVTPEDQLAPGARVMIRSGTLAGLQGTILKTASGRRFIVQVNFIQRGASILLDDCDLEKIEEA